jgi:hypothetical protein
MENLIVASVREDETRLLAEFQQHRAAQMEYMEKRMHELITQSTHEIVAEILLKINATGQSGSPPTVSEIVASFQETKARELEKAIADLALKIEVGAATSVQPADLKCLADVLRNENDELRERTHNALGLVRKEMERFNGVHGTQEILRLQQQVKEQRVAHEHAMREKNLKMELLEQRVQTLERAAATPPPVPNRPPSIHLNCVPNASVTPTVVNVANTFSNATSELPARTQSAPSGLAQGKYRLLPLAVSHGSSPKGHAPAQVQAPVRASVRAPAETCVQGPARTQAHAPAQTHAQAQPLLTHTLLSAAVMNAAAPIQLTGGSRQVMTIGSSPGHGVPPLVLSHLLKSAEMPIFSGKAEEFSQWKWEFENRCKLLSQGHEIDEATKTHLLERALNDRLRELYHTLRRSENITYTPFMAMLELDYGNSAHEAARTRWERVELAHQGKVTSQIFREFQTKFMAAMHEVVDVTPHEALRLLTTKLPDFLRFRIADRQTALNEGDPTVILSMDMGIPNSEVEKNVLAPIGQRHTRVSTRPNGEYEIHLPTRRLAKLLASLHGRQHEGQSSLLSMRLEDYKMELDEVFDYLYESLENKDRNGDTISGREQQP